MGKVLAMPPSNKPSDTVSDDQWLFLAQLSVRSPRKLFIYIILYTKKSGSKHPKNSLFNFEKRSTVDDSCEEAASPQNLVSV